MTPEEFRAKHPAWCLEDGHHPWSTVRASGETKEQALDRLSAEIEERETAARHREIGALVERLIDGRCLSVEDSGGDWITASLVQIVDGREVELGDVQGEVGLLEALRSLAAELEVSGE